MKAESQKAQKLKLKAFKAAASVVVKHYFMTLKKILLIDFGLFVT